MGSVGGILEERSTGLDNQDGQNPPPAYGPSYSPNMLNRTAPRQDTPANKPKAAAPSSTRRLRGHIEHDHIEEEVLATPRYNLRQTPSSLRTTARSPRTATLRPRSTTKVHYGSDLDSDLFGIDDL